MNHTVKSLVFVVESSLNAIQVFTAQLQNMQPGDKRIPPMLKSLTTESDVLSSALVSASKHIENLPELEGQKRKYDPEKGRLLLSQAESLFAAIEFGFCPRCGNVNKHEITSLG